MAEHHVSVLVHAPVEQVYPMFTHFNDFPKFMRFVKEVTYYDDTHSHWVAEVAGHHEWDAVNIGWQTNRQIGWDSTNGLENRGAVTFQSTSRNQTQVTVMFSYNPPAGTLGDASEALGVGKRFEQALQDDLNNFARMVEQAPPGARDPNIRSLRRVDAAHARSAAGWPKTTLGSVRHTKDTRYAGYEYYAGAFHLGATGKDWVCALP
ncbi:MAG: SRPBCC family protein [Nitrososphaerota archaeon]